VTRRIFARQRLGKHIPATTNTKATIGQLPFLFNGAVNTTIEEAVFSTGPPRIGISSTEENKFRMRMERVLGSQRRMVRMKIDCGLL
jgi:hypothetical protein